MSPTCTTCQIDEGFGPARLREHCSRLPDTLVVAVISSDVTLVKENLGYEALQEWRQHKIVSRAFEQKQVFAQMLGGYFRKNEKVEKVKIEMARVYDQKQVFAHSLGGYSHRERCSRTREI